MTLLEISLFSKICRLCLKEDDDLVNIFLAEAAEVITKITLIEIKDGDFLPENICKRCRGKAIEFDNFRQLWEANDLALKAALEISGQNEQKDSISEHNSTGKNILQQPVSTEHSSQLMADHSEATFETNGQQGTSCKGPLKIKCRYKDLVPLEIYNQTLNSLESRQEGGGNSVGPVHEEKIRIGDSEEWPFEGKSGCTNEDNEESGLGESQSTECQEKFCEHCQSKVDPESHLKECHPEDGSNYCYLCPKGSSSAYATVKQLRAHLKYHTQTPKLQCEECGKWFRYPQQKVVHMRVHTGERPAICNVCNKSFMDPRYLAVHLKSHKGEKPFKCPTCHKGFGHKFNLKLHLKTHTLERDHMCSMCGKTFIYAHNLKVHMRQHTGEKPYSCRFCFTSFISASVLNVHMLTHSDQKRFECKECGKKFKRTSYLTIHMRSHTGEKPYACTLCGNKYKMSSHLTEHMKTHTGEKNYICEVCSKSFYNNKALQVHKESHAGKKTYSCPHCDKCFVHHTSLYAHKRKQHREQQ